MAPSAWWSDSCWDDLHTLRLKFALMSNRIQPDESSGRCVFTGPRVLVQLRFITLLVAGGKSLAVDPGDESFERHSAVLFFYISIENGLRFIHIHASRYAGHVLVTSAVTVRTSARSLHAGTSKRPSDCSSVFYVNQLMRHHFCRKCR